MVWGALFGRLLGMTMQRYSTYFSNVTPGMYALLGAFSALGGITRLTLSLAIIMFELTGTLNYIIPCMICLTVSKLIGDLFGREGYIEMKIQEKMYPFLDHGIELTLGLLAKEIMTPFEKIVSLQEQGLRIRDLKAVLNQNTFQGYPVISSLEEKQIVGYITRGDIEYALENIGRIYGIDPNALIFFKEIDSELDESPHSPNLVKDLPISIVSEYTSPFHSTPSRVVDLSGFLDNTPLGIDQNLPVDTVIDMFTKLGLRVVLVKENGKLLGIITKKDLLKEIS